MTHNASSATRPLLAPGWPIRSQLWAELTNQRLRLCPTLHPAGQWLSGYLCRLYYLYQLWWITWGCSLIVQWFGFQEKQIKKSLGNISSSLKPSSHSDEETLWWRGDGLIPEYTLPAQEVARPITDKHTVRCKYKSTGWDGAYLATS